MGLLIYRRNRLPLKKTMFPTISNMFNTPADLLKLHGPSWTFISAEELANTWGDNFNLDEYIQIRYIINTTLQGLHINLGNLNILKPNRPPILNLILMSVKGCSTWTKLLKQKFFKSSNLVKYESKWDTRLNAIQGVFFWNKCYNFTKNILFNNRIKWFHYQIIRGSLKTNYIVSKFTDISPLGTFCNQDDEKIEHLLWECNFSRDFYTNVLPHYKT